MTPARGTTPLPLFRAIVASRQARARLDVGDFSITELLKPAYMRRLQLEHPDLPEDADDMVWSLFGTALHRVLQDANERADHTLAEERLGMVLNVGGKDWMVTGGTDLYWLDPGDDRTLADAWVLSDAKVTSVWTRIYGDRIDEWTWQLNGYRTLWVEAGFPVDCLSILAIYRDWSAGKARSEGQDYPAAQWEEIPIQVLNEYSVRHFFAQRIEAHIDPDPAPCTPAEMWEKPDSWAVLGPDSTRARRVCATEAEAQALIRPSVWAVVKANTKRAIRVCNTVEEAGGIATGKNLDAGDDIYNVEERPSGDRVEFRPGDRVRCTGGAGGRPFCPVASVCPVRAAWLAAQNQKPTEGGGDAA